MSPPKCFITIHLSKSPLPNPLPPPPLPFPLTLYTKYALSICSIT